jgi:hypothetical protein
MTTATTTLPDLSSDQLKLIENAIENLKSVLEDFVDLEGPPMYRQDESLRKLWDSAVGIWEQFETLEEEVAPQEEV